MSHLENGTWPRGRVGPIEKGVKPSGWRRVIAGVIALVLGAPGTVALVSGIQSARREAECESRGGWFCDFWTVDVVVGAYLLAGAAAFALATVLPFGTGRRITVGLGTAMLAAPLFVYVGAQASGAHLALPLLFITGAVAGFWAGYLLAR